jgi:DNA/RNA-binding protein KIN17
MIDDFSNEFHSSFMEVLRRRGSNRQLANGLYQEVIGDRHHTHMNSTKWGSLTAYVKYLQEQGLAEVEDTPKGLFIQYIDQDPDSIKRAEERQRLERAEQRDAQRFQKQLAQRIAALSEQSASVPDEERQLKAFERTEGAKIGFAINAATANGSTNTASTTTTGSVTADSNKRKLVPSVFGDDDDDNNTTTTTKTDDNTAATSGANSAAQSSVIDEEKSKKRARTTTESAETERRKSHWIKTGLVVKVINKELAGGVYHKKKGVIITLVDKLNAEVEMLDSGDVLRINQAQLETVLPSVGGAVMVVNGAHRGERGTLTGLEEKKYCALVQLANGGVQSIAYEDVCKVK